MLESCDQSTWSSADGVSRKAPLSTGFTASGQPLVIDRVIHFGYLHHAPVPTRCARIRNADRGHRRLRICRYREMRSMRPMLSSHQTWTRFTLGRNLPTESNGKIIRLGPHGVVSAPGCDDMNMIGDSPVAGLERYECGSERDAGPARQRQKFRYVHDRDQFATQYTGRAR